MKPSTILVLFFVGAICLALGTLWVPKALGLSWWGEIVGATTIGIAYSWGFWPRFFAYSKRWEG